MSPPAADVTSTIAEQTLCPDGVKNVYAGLNFRP
jgi:hypothetical protein